MKYKFFTFILLVVLMGQSASMAHPGWTLEFLADIQHAEMHSQGEGHHHHDDGAYHQDESTESVQHIIADYVIGSPALLAEIFVYLPVMGSIVPASLRKQSVPYPFLEGPLRPPRTTA